MRDPTKPYEPPMFLMGGKDGDDSLDAGAKVFFERLHLWSALGTARKPDADTEEWLKALGSLRDLEWSVAQQALRTAWRRVGWFLTRDPYMTHEENLIGRAFWRRLYQQEIAPSHGYAEGDELRFLGELP